MASLQSSIQDLYGHHYEITTFITTDLYSYHYGIYMAITTGSLQQRE